MTTLLPEMTKQSNFRLSDDAVNLLRRLSSNLGITKTKVIEICIAQHAAEIGVDVDTAKALLAEQLAHAASRRKKTTSSRIADAQEGEAVRKIKEHKERIK